VPLFTQQGLGIALFSYDGGLYWGFNADWDAVPDLHELVTDVGRECAALSTRAKVVRAAGRVAHRRRAPVAARARRRRTA